MRILIFQTAYLGDVVLTTPLAATLRKHLPDAHIAVAVQPAWRPIFEHSGLVDQVISFDKRGADRGNLGTWRFASALKKERFDVALCPHPSFRSGLILALAGIPRRVGFHDSAGKLFFTENVHRDTKSHEVDRVLSLAKAFDIDESGFVRQLQMTPDPLLSISEILSRFDITDDDFLLVGLHPGSVWATKRWIPENFAIVARQVAKMGPKVLVFGTDAERPLVEKIVAKAKHDRVIPVIGLHLPELIAAFTRLSLYITNDSGPMHIACALGVPTIALFGSTVPALGYAPFSERSAVVEVDRLSCRPCGPHGFNKCPLEHFKCMRNLKPQTVLLSAKIQIGGFKGTGFEKAGMPREVAVNDKDLFSVHPRGLLKKKIESETT